MLKHYAAAVALACGLLATPAFALQAVVSQVDKNADGSMTYHFAVRTSAGETLNPGTPTAPADFVTVYNFYGLVDGSPQSPPGWEFSSEQFGRTPSLDGYPLVLPIDIPNTPNLTWTVTKPIAGGAEVDGFTATTKVATMVQGEYAAQVTHQIPAVPGLPAQAAKQAMIGLLPGPSFLAEVK